MTFRIIAMLTLALAAELSATAVPAPAQSPRQRSDTRETALKRYGWSLPICWTAQAGRRVICTNIATLSAAYPQYAIRMSEEVKRWALAKAKPGSDRLETFLDAVVNPPSVIACPRQQWRSGTVTLGHSALVGLDSATVDAVRGRIDNAKARLAARCKGESSEYPAVPGGDRSAVGVAMEMFSILPGGTVAQNAYAHAYQACKSLQSPGAKIAEGEETEEQKKKRLEDEKKKAEAAKKKAEEEKKKAEAAKKKAEAAAKAEADAAKKAEIEQRIKDLEAQIRDLQKQVDILQDAADAITDAIETGSAAAGGALAVERGPYGAAAAIAGTGLYIIGKGLWALGKAGLYYKPPMECIADDESCAASCESRARAAAWKALIASRTQHDNCADRVMPKPDGSYECPRAGAQRQVDTQQVLRERCRFIQKFYSDQSVSCESARVSIVADFESRFAESVCKDPRAMCTAEQGSGSAEAVRPPVVIGGQPIPVWVPGGKLGD